MSTPGAPTEQQLTARRERVAATAAGLEHVLVTTLVNVRYLTGFTGSNGAFVLHADGSGVFLTDGRYRDQAAIEVPGGGHGVEHVITRDLLGEAAARVSGRVGIETHTLSVDAHGTLVRAGLELAPTGRLVERAREAKDDHEVEALRTACRITVEAFAGLLEGPLLGRSERAVARDLENRMLDLGAEAIAFETILASGPNTAIPHHHPTDRVLAAGDLLKADFGARVAGYHADFTRTVVLGTATPWQREIHAAVREAQAAGVTRLVAGEPVAASDRVVRDSLEAAGHLEHFTTGLGHGVGLQIHEDPFIGAQHAGTLDRRTVLTMEPGIYLPGRGGVRIEDTVLVAEPGQRPDVLTEFTTDLLEIA